MKVKTSPGEKKKKKGEKGVAFSEPVEEAAPAPEQQQSRQQRVGLSIRLSLERELG